MPSFQQTVVISLHTSIIDPGGFILVVFHVTVVLLKKMKPKGINSRNIRSLLLDNLRGHCGQESPKLTDAINNLSNVITRTALYGESNSVLVIGPQGAGKTRLLHTVLEKLKRTAKVTNNLLQVHLNGLLQTDDKIALKEITRQLQLENAAASRLFASFSENLRFLLDSLKHGTGTEDSKSILFVLDEFDLFCHHKNQTLLYNLFDISQSAQTPIAVIGLTCRLDVVELLEKRVKSRFSHRQIHIFPMETFAEYTDLAIDLLRLPSEYKAANEWNESIKKLFKSKMIRNVLQRYYNGTKDIRSLKNLLFVAVSAIKEADRTFPSTAISESFRLLTNDSKSAMLNSLSVLELCLVISMASLTIKYDGEPFNFQMLYDEYLKFAHSYSTVQTYNYSSVSKAFDHLKALEYVQLVSGAAGKVSSNFQLLTLMLDTTQITDALKSYPNLPTNVEQWAASALSY